MICDLFGFIFCILQPRGWLDQKSQVFESHNDFCDSHPNPTYLSFNVHKSRCLTRVVVKNCIEQRILD